MTQYLYLAVEPERTHGSEFIGSFPVNQKHQKSCNALWVKKSTLYPFWGHFFYKGKVLPKGRFSSYVTVFRREGGGVHPFLDLKMKCGLSYSLDFFNSALFTELTIFDHSSRHLHFRGAAYGGNRTFLIYFKTRKSDEFV